jgi:pilus assembly protein CpaB
VAGQRHPERLLRKHFRALSDGRRAVLSPIEENEPVLSWKVTGPGERATLSAVVDDGMRAMSVRINDVLGVAGFVLPGDRVDIMLTRDNYTDILLQNVKILAIDQIADERPTSRRPARPPRSRSTPSTPRS